MKLVNRTIEDRYFNELVNEGHAVPRDRITGETLTFRVSQQYIIKNKQTGHTQTAICTQDCPCSLKKIVI